MICAKDKKIIKVNFFFIILIFDAYYCKFVEYLTHLLKIKSYKNLAFLIFFTLNLKNAILFHILLLALFPS